MMTSVLQGYDMEDAMILNKAAVERGFAHASVYKCEVKLFRAVTIRQIGILHIACKIYFCIAIHRCGYY